MKKLYELSMTLSGDPMEVFGHAARMIGELMDVKVVCLSEIRGDRLDFLSVYANGEIYLNAGSCSLDITPCSTVENSKDIRIYDRVMERFPQAKFLKEHSAFSYCGFPALDNSGKVVAVTCLLDDRPHEFSEEDQETLRIFGQRIGMELERQSHIRAREEAELEVRRHRDHLEEMVRKRTQELEAANRELEAFSYSVSHDLRAPLRAIDGFSVALMEDYGEKLDETAKDYLARVRSGAQRMGSMIDDILRLSRVNRSELHRSRVDLSALAKDIVHALETADPGRRVRVDIAPDLAADGDEGLLDLLLQNLLGNAWKFTSGKTDASIEIGSRADGEKRVFFVRDNGAGFDMRYVSKLFGAFQRLHTDEEFPGTGIGLATVRRIANRHGG
ncbi:MAG TPA: histidine kinase dimerization/phospho-acceptor domain-containing protein, partial [Burkholderiales bacterium]|nr:histidine kinase dimerization/phospho-acceptor domain-containing protein [Burkholderiales bacterium]